MAGFGGAWMRKQFSVDPDELLHTADPAHGTPGHGDDPNPVWQMEIPEERMTPEFMADYGDMNWLVADTNGLVLDTTPDTHSEGGGGAKSYPNEVQSQQGAYAASGADYGSADRHVFNVPPMQDSTTRYESRRFEGVDVYAPPVVALQRGLNALPENNPDGFRRGWVEQQYVDRKLYDPERIHDRRLNTLNVATVATNQPVPEGASVYNSPFASLARILTNINQKPMVRREPPPISESVVTDGEESMYDANSGDWVVG
jgi:hypothetical protein